MSPKPLKNKNWLQNQAAERLENKRLKEHIESIELKESAIEDLLHELRRINKFLKKSLQVIPVEELDQNFLDIWSYASILSIRLQTYDFETNPNFLQDTQEYAVPIYKRIERISKSLRQMYANRNVDFDYKGACYVRFKTTDIIEIAFYIVLDNALKYALPNTKIVIRYTPSGETLKVTFSNQAQLPDESEMTLLENRKYRGVNTKDKYEGSGLGLNIFSRICQILKIEKRIYCNRDLNDPSVGSFCVEMTMGPVFKTAADEHPKVYAF